MRITKEDQIKHLEWRNKVLEDDTRILKAKLEVADKYMNSFSMMSEALKTTTEAVAHVLTDLKRR